MTVSEQRSEITFVPKYAWRFRLAFFVAMPLMAVLGLFAVIVDRGHEPKLLLSLMFPVGLVFMLAMTYKRVRFGSSIVAERYLFPPRTFEYASITDVGSGLLKTTQGKLYFMSQNCDNIDEFDEAVEESRKRGFWSEHQIENKVLTNQIAGARAAMISIPIAIVGAIAVTIVRPGRWTWIASFIVIQLAVGYPLYLYYRRRLLENKRSD